MVIDSNVIGLQPPSLVILTNPQQFDDDVDKPRMPVINGSAVRLLCVLFCAKILDVTH